MTAIFSSSALGLAVLLGASAPAAAQSQTAQSAMVSVTLESGAYEIEGTITWTFDRGTHREPGTAMESYTNVRTSGPTFVTCSGSPTNCGGPNTPSSTAINAAEPAADEIKLQQQAQAEKCTFFLGGTLTSTSYTQTATVNGANGSGSWKYSWTYAITPVIAVVDPYTAWSSVETGGTVDVGFSGFVASESFLKQSAKNKYSFTMIEGGVTRARNVSGALQKWDGLAWTDVATADLNNVDTDLDTINDGLAIVPATADFPYYGNAGIFGNSAVFSALHAAGGGKPANGVVNILTGASDGSPADNFAGNNNDLAAGNVHLGPFASDFPGLTEAGDYRVAISGQLKGNGSSADFGFSVASALTVIGGCTAP